MSGSARVGALLALGLATFASAPVLIRLAGPDADPLAIALVRTVTAALVLTPFWWLHPTGRASTPPEARSTAAWSVLAGLFLALHFSIWTTALRYTSVASASVLVTCHPVLLIVIESVFLRAAFTRTTWAGVLFAFAGTAMLAWVDRAPAATYADPLVGNALAFTAALMFVGYILISQKIRRRHTWLDYVGRVYLAAAVVTTLIFLLAGRTLGEVTPSVIGTGIALALGAQLVGHGALNYAVRFFPPTLLSTLILVEPVVAMLLALVLFAETPAPLAVVAMAATLGGVLLGWWGRRGDEA